MPKYTEKHTNWKKMCDICLDEAPKKKKSSHLFSFVSVYLTMHLIALYKGFIILQVCAGVPDVGPDVFIKIPGIKTALLHTVLYSVFLQQCGQYLCIIRTYMRCSPSTISLQIYRGLQTGLLRLFILTSSRSHQKPGIVVQTLLLLSSYQVFWKQFRKLYVSTSSATYMHMHV